MSFLFRSLVFLALLAAGTASAQIRIEEVTSPGGIRAWLVHEPSIPFVALSIGFRGGASLDPAGKEGVTNLMAGLLEEGTGDMDARAFREAADALGARFSFEAGRDAVRVTAQILTENRAETLALLRRALVEPAFAPDAIERVRAQVLSSIEQDLQNPQAIAARTLDALAYPDHPYGRPADGTLESVRALTREDIVAAHRAVMSRDHVVVSAVGDITAGQLGPLLDALLEGLPETGARLPPEVPFGAPGGVTVVEFPTPQSAAVWGGPGPGIDDPDFMAVHVMNHILGGSGFGSRLTEEVREKRGLTYGIYTYVAFRAFSNQMGGGVASANETIAEALRIVREEYARMARDGVTAEELELAKKNLTGSYALRFDGNANISRILLSMQIDEFPVDYVNTRNDRVEAVTLEDIRRVARRFLDPDRYRFVVVGQPVGLEATD